MRNWLTKKVKINNSDVQMITGGCFIQITYVLDKNDGFKTVKTYFESGNLNVNNLDIYITQYFLNCFKYAPITSVDIERSFCIYKYILSNRRHNFKKHNLEICIIIYFNSEK